MAFKSHAKCLWSMSSIDYVNLQENLGQQGKAPKGTLPVLSLLTNKTSGIPFCEIMGAFDAGSKVLKLGLQQFCANMDTEFGTRHIQ